MLYEPVPPGVLNQVLLAALAHGYDTASRLKSKPYFELLRKLVEQEDEGY